MAIDKQDYACPFPITGTTVVHEGREYKLMGKIEALQFRQLTDGLAGWKLRSDKEGVFVWDRQVNGETAIKVFAVYDCEPQLMWDMLQDAVYRVVWDDSRLDSYRIALLDQKNDIGYYAAKSPMIVSNRDFLNQRAWHSAGNGEFLIFNSSVKHSSCGEKDGFVRAVSKLSGYLIRPYSHASEKKQQCSLTYLTITDMGGWIPGMVMNFVTTTFAPTKMSKIRVAIDGFKKWLPQQNDYVKDWEVPEDGWDSAQPNEIHDFVKRREAKGDLATPIACSTDDFAENES